MDTGNGSGSRKPRRFLPTETKLAIVKAHLAGEATLPELARAYGVFPTTIYTRVARYKKVGEAGLKEMKRSPGRPPKPDPVAEKLAPEILETKKKFAWFGITRIVQWLRRTKNLPVTAHQVRKTLEKAQLVPPKPRKRRRSEAIRFFERSEPNQLWQSDITWWTAARGQKMYLIAFLDDYSRYIVGWGLYGSQGKAQVLETLRNAIGQYGSPKEILTDHGRRHYAWRHRTRFQRELVKHEVRHVVSAAHHPQTKGKIEAFFKRLKVENPEEKPAPEVEGSGGAQPEAAAGSPPDAGLPPAQPEAVRGDAPRTEARSQEGKTAEGGDAGGPDGSQPRERADSQIEEAGGSAAGGAPALWGKSAMRSVRTRSDLTERAKVFLAAGVGEIAVTEACRQLDMTRQRFYELEDRPMAAEFRELEPKPAGRPPKAVDPRAALEKQAAVLQKEKDRLWLYIRVLQRMAGIDNPETETKRSPRRASDGDKAHDR